jgi:DNA-binding IclR family transcriptional regulator
VPRETSQTLDRGLTVLELLTKTPAGRTVTELAADLGVGRTVVYRLLATLESHGLVRRDHEGRARLWLGVIELANAVQPLLRRAALPILRTLAEEVGATAFLTIAEGGEAVALAVVEPSWTDFHVAYRVGSRHPLDLGASGRAILAGRKGDPSYVTTTGELQPGAHGIAAPVIGATGVEASLGVVTLVPLDEGAVGPRVVVAAERLGHSLR